MDPLPPRLRGLGGSTCDFSFRTRAAGFTIRVVIPVRSGWLACLASLALASPALAREDQSATESEPVPVPAIPAVASSETEKLHSLEGETVRVTGLVKAARTSPSGHQFLDFAGSEFMTVTFRSDLDEFGEALPADTYEGKTVAITGPVKIYKGIPEIILNHPSLIEIIPASEAIVPPPPPEPEKIAEAAPEPSAPEPEPEKPALKEKVDEKKPPVDWRLYFPDPAEIKAPE